MKCFNFNLEYHLPDGKQKRSLLIFQKNKKNRRRIIGGGGTDSWGLKTQRKIKLKINWGWGGRPPTPNPPRRSNPIERVEKNWVPSRFMSKHWQKFQDE